ncbi:DUF3426 domain-containing protein [Microbulbifer celer]|uniref:DUF3426 domain-containing protein n=1 Tax=Microbulbifer celer TaxID=435905 RepID=A0ABW3U803_9GAMM|nr:DUF3426 domain-containing protein [Microbulbifer celer]UFN56558.1 DUF3426 domain-containing protein [Microbulbifer celer]
MSQLVTRCPHCSTSFHVSEQQLRAARGAVRCGSCLQVFRADENIVFNEDDPEQPVTTRKAIEELLEDDDFLIHDDIELDGEDHADASGSDSETAQDRKPAPPAEPKPAPREQPLIDDAFGEQQWHDLSNDREKSSDNHYALKPDALDEIESDPDNPWAEEIASEETAGIPGPGEWDNPIANENADNSDLLADEQFDQRRPGTAAPESLATEIPSPGARSGETSRGMVDDAPLLPRDQLISGIGPAPLEVAWQPKRHSRVRSGLWALSALLLILIAIGQTAYFRFDTLSKREPWRQIYAAVCPTLGCQLPAQVDVQSIHTANLVVRSHPQIPGALAVEAVLINRAPFEQPFPALQLEFSDIKNRPVASRRFVASEYLKGELAGRRLMPTGNPVHIAIDIVDPGAEAVNYELQIAAGQVRR